MRKKVMSKLKDLPLKVDFPLEKSTDSCKSNESGSITPRNKSQLLTFGEEPDKKGTCNTKAERTFKPGDSFDDMSIKTELFTKLN